MSDRRSFVAWLGSLPLVGRPRPLGAVPPIVIDATPTALYQQPDGRNNLVRVAVMGLDAPAARARVTDRRGTLVGTAGLLPTGASLAGELWVPLSRAVGAEFQIDVEVGKQRVGSRRVRLAPPRRWTLYWIASSHTDVGLTERHEECLEVHRRNLDAALARLPAHPEFRWTAECGLQLISYVENRPAAAGEALARAIRDGKLGVSAVFAQALTGILDHETFARVLWPTGLFAREHGLGYQAAQLADVPGHPFTLPTLLAASGVRYLASGVNPERAAPLLSPADAARAQLAGGDWTASSARWSGAGARSCQFGVATPGAIARTVRRPPRRSSGATAPRSSRPGPRSCSRCGTRRPSRRVAARPNASSNGPRRAGECGGICCCSASKRGGRRPADRTPTARTPSRSGSTSGGSWTARRPRPTPRSRPRCCGSASALAGAGARAASYSTLRAGRGATWGECRTARRGGSSTRVENGPRWISPTAPRWWWRETSPRWATWRSRKVSEPQIRPGTRGPRSRRKPVASTWCSIPRVARSAR